MLLAAGHVTEMVGNQQEWTYILLDMVVLAALIGIYLFQRKNTGVVGTIAYSIAMAGTAVLLFDFLAAILFPVGAAMFSAGLILLAACALKAGRLPRWALILWIIAPVVGLPGLFWQALDTPF